MASEYTRYPPLSSGSSGVSSLNTQTGDITLVAGTNITITPGSGTLTIASTGGSGGVTSVALADASTAPIYAISGSPVTSSGTLTLTLETQSANAVFAGPSSGSAAQPTFRALASADIPNNAANTTGTAANITGVAAIANGGSGQSTQAAAITALTGTQSSGKYLRSDGTNATLQTIQAGDVPTLNQNTTGTAANITASSNSTLTTLSSLSLPYSQVTGGPSGGVTSVGTIDTYAVANGLDIVGTSIYAQSASATEPGMVNTTAQSFAGQKLFVIPPTSPGSGGAGNTAEAWGADSVSLGYFAGHAGTGSFGIAVGFNAQAAGTTAIGIGGNANAGGAGAIAIGYNATAAIAQFVVGSPSSGFEITDMFLGSGVKSSTANTNVAIHASGGSGTNNAGSNLVLDAGISTGNATPAVVTIQAAPVGSSGSTAQTLQTVATFGATSIILNPATTIGASSTTPQHSLNTTTATPASNVGTLTNLPTAYSGNPAGFIQISINGNTQIIPYW